MIRKRVLSIILIFLMLSCFLISADAVITYSNITPSNGSYGVSPNIANWSVTTHNATGSHVISGYIRLYYTIDNIPTSYSRTLTSVVPNGTYALNFTSGLYWGRDYTVYLQLHETGHNVWHNTSYTFSTKYSSGEIDIIGIDLLMIIVLFIFGISLVLFAFKQKKIDVKTVGLLAICMVILIIMGAIVVTIT